MRRGAALSGCLLLLLLTAGGGHGSQPSRRAVSWARQVWDQITGVVSMQQGKSHPDGKAQPEEELDVFWGIPDTVATVGHLFSYAVPANAFSGKVQYFKVYEAGSAALPSWLYFNSTSRSFVGVASPVNQGAVAIEVTASNDEGPDKASTHFIITVQVPDLTSSSWSGDTGLANHKRYQPADSSPLPTDVCDWDQNTFRAILVLDATFDSIDAQARVRLLYRASRFLSKSVHSVTVRPKRSASVAHLLDTTTVTAGPGDVGPNATGAGVELSWIVGCSDFQSEAASLAKVLQHNIAVGRIHTELGYRVIGWMITETLPPEALRGLSRQKRQVRVRGTPMPTPTLPSTAPSVMTEIPTTSLHLTTTRFETFVTSSVPSVTPTSASTDVSATPVTSMNTHISSSVSASTRFETSVTSSVPAVTPTSASTDVSPTPATFMTTRMSSAVSALPQTDSVSLDSSDAFTSDTLEIMPSETTGLSPSGLDTLSPSLSVLDSEDVTLTETPMLDQTSITVLQTMDDSLLPSPGETFPVSSSSSSPLLDRLSTSIRLVTTVSLTSTFDSSSSEEALMSSEETFLEVSTMPSPELPVTPEDSSTSSAELPSSHVPSSTATATLEVSSSMAADTSSSEISTSARPEPSSLETGPSFTTLASSQRTVTASRSLSPTYSTAMESSETQAPDQTSSPPSMQLTPSLSSSLTAFPPTTATSILTLTPRDSVLSSAFGAETETSPLSVTIETDAVVSSSTSDQPSSTTFILSSTLFYSELPETLQTSVTTVVVVAPGSSSSFSSSPSAVTSLMSSSTFPSFVVPPSSVESSMTSTPVLSSSIQSSSTSTSPIINLVTFTPTAGQTLGVVPLPTTFGPDLPTASVTSVVSRSVSIDVTSSSSVGATDSVSSPPLVTSTSREDSTPVVIGTTSTLEITTDARTSTLMVSSSPQPTTTTTDVTVTPSIGVTTFSPLITPELSTLPPLSTSTASSPASPTPTALSTEPIAPTSTFTVSSTTPLVPNRPPELIYSIDRLYVDVGIYFELEVPVDTFYDFEDGNTRFLTLSLLTLRGSRELSADSWLQFKSAEQVIFGLLLADDLPLSDADREFVLVARDVDGLASWDAIKVIVNTSSIANVSHEFSLTIDGDHEQYMNSTVSLIELLTSISRYYDDERPTLMTVANVSAGSVQLWWSNNTLSKTVCENATIEQLYERLSGGGRVHPDLRRALSGRYSVRAVGLRYLGVCSPSPPPGPPLGPGPTDPPIYSSSDASIYYKTIIPVVVLALLLVLVGLIAVCLLRRRKLAGRLLLDDEKPIFTKDRHPVLLESEIEMHNVHKPHRPCVLGGDHADGDPERHHGAYVNPAFRPPPARRPPPYRIPTTYAPFFRPDSDLDGASLSPPPDYVSDPGAGGGAAAAAGGVYERPPPSYRLPPPYTSYPGSSDA